LEHLLIPASWKSAAAMKNTIREREEEDWSVVALGDISGGNTLVLVKDGHSYEHEVIQIFWSLRGKVEDIIKERQEDGWTVATVGACLGSTLLVMKRKLN